MNYQWRRTHRSLFAHPYPLHPFPLPITTVAHSLDTPSPIHSNAHFVHPSSLHTFQLPIATDAPTTLLQPYLPITTGAHALGTLHLFIHATTAINAQLWYVSGFRTLSICLGCRGQDGTLTKYLRQSKAQERPWLGLNYCLSSFLSTPFLLLSVKCRKPRM